MRQWPQPGFFLHQTIQPNPPVSPVSPGSQCADSTVTLSFSFNIFLSLSLSLFSLFYPLSLHLSVSLFSPHLFLTLSLSLSLFFFLSISLPSLPLTHSLSPSLCLSSSFSPSLSISLPLSLFNLSKWRGHTKTPEAGLKASPLADNYIMLWLERAQASPSAPPNSDLWCSDPTTGLFLPQTVRWVQPFRHAV